MMRLIIIEAIVIKRGVLIDGTGRSPIEKSIIVVEGSKINVCR